MRCIVECDETPADLIDFSLDKTPFPSKTSRISFKGSWIRLKSMAVDSNDRIVKVMMPPVKGFTKNVISGLTSIKNFLTYCSTLAVNGSLRHLGQGLFFRAV